MGVRPRRTTFTATEAAAAAAYVQSTCCAAGRFDGLLQDRPMKVARMAIGHVSVSSVQLPGTLRFETEHWPGYLVTQ